MKSSGPRRIVICDLASKYSGGAGVEVLTVEQLRTEVHTGRLTARLWKYDEAVFFSSYYEARHTPLAIAILLGILARRKCFTHGPDGPRNLGIRAFLEVVFHGLMELMGRRRVLKHHAWWVRELRRTRASKKGQPRAAPRALEEIPVYLRIDTWIGVRAGGSLAHIGGVFNNLHRFGRPPVMITSDAIPTVAPDSEMHVVPLQQNFINFPAVRAMEYNKIVIKEAKRLLGRRQAAFVYQRYALNGVAGLTLAREWSVPFVLEWNGSEIWVNENWGSGERWFGYELSVEIEELNLRSADLIVTPSQANKDILLSKGVAADRIVVVPNGVDPRVYRPDVDGNIVRKRFGLEGKLVIGFIGTFGRWHGAEVLCQAFADLLRLRPDLKERVRLFLIGDGMTRAACERVLVEQGAAPFSVLPGLVDQREGPFYLAACDVLVAPTVEPADGSVFFGSPTKLFEYMAMGKAIVASGVGQVADVLQHDKNALLMSSGDPDALCQALIRLCDDGALRQRLGTAAHQKALTEHTWIQHTDKILDEIRSRFGGR